MVEKRLLNFFNLNRLVGFYFFQKSPIDTRFYCSYNDSAMKRFVFIFCLIFCFVLNGCASVGQTEVTDNSSSVTDEWEDDDTQDIKKKKFYAVSKVNGLRVRSNASTNSTVLGYLDKNDIVSYTKTVGDFYQTVYKESCAYVYAPYCELLGIEESSSLVEKAIDTGATLLGYPYVWGSQRYHWGNGVLNKNFVQGEFDCSALVQYVYYHAAGVLMDVTSRTQVKNGVEVKRSELSRGDVMFFTNASRKNNVGDERIGHVGVYFGNGYILHTASDHAVIEPISELRWSYYITARRVI